MPLVEKLLGRLDDRGHDPGPTDDVAGRAHCSVTRAPGDLPDLEGKLRCACERVSALIHRGRTCMGRLPPPGDPVTLDPERSQNRAEWEIERLEDGALLDVELEVRRRCLQLASSLERTVEVDVVLAQCVRKGDAVPVP